MLNIVTYVCSKLGPENFYWWDNGKEKDDYCESCIHMGLKCIGHEKYTSDCTPENAYLFELQVTDEEEEAPPVEESNCDEALVVTHMFILGFLISRVPRRMNFKWFGCKMA